MASKRVTGRQSRYAEPEQNLSPRERRNFNEQMDQIFREIPAKGKRAKTNPARTLLEDRE